MKFLFNPDEDLALPLFWQENRMVLLGGLVIALLAYCKPTWNSYKNLIQIYRESGVNSRKPAISPLVASYIYNQGKVTCMTAWLVDLCCRRALSLRYRKKLHPWSLRRKRGSKVDDTNKELLNILFRNSDIVQLKASFSDPDPDVKETAEKLYKATVENNNQVFHNRQSGLPGWILLFGLISEIPFYIASQSSNLVATLPVTLFSTAICVAPVYVICAFLPQFFNGPRITAFAMLTLSLLFALFGQFLIFSSASTASYWSAAFFPNIAAAIITMVYQAPLLPKDNFLLPQIIDYQKHLAEDGYQIQEEDIPWTLGLGVHADIIERSFRYGGRSMPEWLLRSSEDDVQVLMKMLHQTFATDVNRAINGETSGSKNSRRSGSSLRGNS